MSDETKTRLTCVLKIILLLLLMLFGLTSDMPH